MSPRGPARPATWVGSPVIGERIPRDKMEVLLREAGVDPRRLRPALRHVERGGLPYRVRCWIFVDDQLTVEAPVSMCMRRPRGQKCASPALLIGKVLHIYELED